jgi:phosphatidylserine decarboxylase
VRIDRAGFPFISGTAALATAAALTVGSAGAVPLFVVVLFFTFFFRDPDRQAPAIAEVAVLSPADGRVLVAGPADAGGAPAGDWLQVSIFLSPMDVHVNRTPVSGLVMRVDFKRGKFLPAYQRDASRNEHSEIWVDHNGQTIVFRQIVGMLARRVVCRVQPGTRLKAGERIGLMKFGSRMDVFLPTSAHLSVSAGDRVVGGVTVIATL